MVKIKSIISKSDKIMTITLAFIIITMAMISSYSITKNFPHFAYAVNIGTETSNMNNGENVTDTSMKNANVTETNIPDSGNLIPNQYIIVLKENATFTPQLANNTISSLTNEWSNLGLNITSLPEVGMLTIDLNQTLEQGREADITTTDTPVSEILEKIQNNSNIDYIEPNQIFEIK